MNVTFTIKQHFRFIPSALRTVPTIVIAHTFCAPQNNTRVSYGVGGGGVLTNLKQNKINTARLVVRL